MYPVTNTSNLLIIVFSILTFLSTISIGADAVHGADMCIIRVQTLPSSGWLYKTNLLSDYVEPFPELRRLFLPELQNVAHLQCFGNSLCFYRFSF